MSTTEAGTAREGTGVMDTTETTRLRALRERAALPACEAQHAATHGAWITKQRARLAKGRE